MSFVYVFLKECSVAVFTVKARAGQLHGSLSIAPSTEKERFHLISTTPGGLQLLITLLLTFLR